MGAASPPSRASRGRSLQKIRLSETFAARQTTIGALAEFLDFLLFGKTSLYILAANRKFGPLFFSAIHSGSELAILVAR